MSKAYKISRRCLIVSGLSTAALATLSSRFIASANVQKVKGSEMTTLMPYLLFDGHCHQAMEF
jgi:hypothetical protein